MAFLYVLLQLLALLSCAQATAESAVRHCPEYQVLQNSGFEDNISGVPWVFVGNTSVVHAAGEGRLGSNQFVTANVNGKVSNSSLIQRLTNLDTTQEYIIRTYFRIPESENHGIYAYPCQLNVHLGDVYIFSSLIDFNKHDGRVYHSYNMVVHPIASTADLRFHFSCSPSASMQLFLDDYTMTVRPRHCSFILQLHSPNSAIDGQYVSVKEFTNSGGLTIGMDYHTPNISMATRFGIDNYEKKSQLFSFQDRAEFLNKDYAVDGAYVFLDNDAATVGFSGLSWLDEVPQLNYNRPREGSYFIYLSCAITPGLKLTCGRPDLTHDLSAWYYCVTSDTKRGKKHPDCQDESVPRGLKRGNRTCGCSHASVSVTYLN